MLRKFTDWLGEHKKLSRKFVMWMVLAAAMFAVSGYLTVKITYVEDHTPMDFFDPHYGRDKNGEPIPDTFHGEIFSVLTPTQDVSPIEVKYFTVGYGDTDVDGHKGAQMTFDIPAHRALRILLNNVDETNQCWTAGAAPPESLTTQSDGKQGHYFTLPAVQMSGMPFRVMTIPDQEDNVAVKCWLNPDIGRETFTNRVTQFSYTGPDSDFTYAPNIEGSERKMADPTHTDYDGYITLENVALTVDIHGADDMKFYGGTPIADARDYDITRRLARYAYTNVRWTDTFREQLRDIYLILIGTLIALAVTCVIEGIRPFVDGKLEEEL